MNDPMSGVASPGNNQAKSNGRGGRRPGSGRKVGSVTKRTREIADGALASGLTPLDYMLTILRDETQEDAARFEAAKAAAPYVHAKLASVDATVKGDMSLTVVINKP